MRSETEQLRDRPGHRDDDERTADELLARIVATPVRELGEEPSRRQRSRGLILAPIGIAVVLGAVVAADLTDPERRGGGVVASAVAAVTSSNAVYHLVERNRFVTLVESARRPPRVRRELGFAESWLGPGGRERTLGFEAAGGRRGELISEVTSRPLPGGRVRNVIYFPDFLIRQTMRPLSPTFGRRIRRLQAVDLDLAGGRDRFEHPGTQLRRLHARGDLRLAGTTRLGERRAYRLVARIASATSGVRRRQVFLVDPNTFLPLQERVWLRLGTPSRRRPGWPERPAPTVIHDYTRTFLIYEKLPATPKILAKLRMSPHPSAKRFLPFNHRP